MTFRLTSKLSHISKPLSLSTSSHTATNNIFKRVLPNVVINDDKSQKNYKRSVSTSSGNRMQSVLLGSGIRRNYSVDTRADISLGANYPLLSKEKEQEIEEKVEKLKKQRLFEVIDKTTRHVGPTGPGTTGDHIKPMTPGQDGRVLGYFLLGTNRAILSTGIRLLVLKLLYSWSANARVMALASVEIDLAAIPQGKTITITFRGKPVFIKHRTPKEIGIIQADDANVAALRDPELDSDRFPLNNEWTVVLAICTHLGCVPVTDAGRWNAFFCPCHGSHYDASGRIRAGPAPLNLAVPPMKFTPHGTLILG